MALILHVQFPNTLLRLLLGVFPVAPFSVMPFEITRPQWVKNPNLMKIRPIYLLLQWCFGCIKQNLYPVCSFRKSYLLENIEKNFLLHQQSGHFCVFWTSYIFVFISLQMYIMLLYRCLYMYVLCFAVLFVTSVLMTCYWRVSVSAMRPCYSERVHLSTYQWLSARLQ